MALVLSTCAAAVAPAAPLRFPVRWVNDGDTIVLAGGERVRYLGIDTPEVAHEERPAEPYAREALNFNRSLVQGHSVRLEFEGPRRDHYGRLLAYVFLEDGTLVNAELVRQGYAHLFRRQPQSRYWKQLLELQRQALEQKRGIWSLAPVNPERVYLGNRRTWTFHRPDCPFGRKTARGNLIRFKTRQQALYDGFSPCRRCRP
jgi:micrococcal nuclease